MKPIPLILGLLFVFNSLTAQVNDFAKTKCSCRHVLFAKVNKKRIHTVTELGKGKQFPLLSGLKNVDAFYDSLKAMKSWNKAPLQKKSIDTLLECIGFKDGLNSAYLTPKSIVPFLIPFDTEGRLGGIYRNRQGKKEINYLSSRLHITAIVKKRIMFVPIPAWKITSPNGCYFYILQKCGNAFYYPNPKCCDTVIAKDTVTVDSVKYDTLRIPVKIPVYTVTSLSCYFKVREPIQQRQQLDKQRPRYRRDSTLCSQKTDTSYRDSSVFQVITKYYTQKIDTIKTAIKCCNKKFGDTTIVKIIHGNLVLVNSIPGEIPAINKTKYIYVNDTCKIKDCPPCYVKFELGLNGGFAYNTVPSLNDAAINTKSGNVHFAGDIYLSYLLSKQLQIGLDAGYLTLAYKDDTTYPKPIGTFVTYNDIYLAKPVIPIQAFGRLNLGSGKFTSQISLSAGYAIVSNSQIQNNGVMLSAKPDVNNGFVAGLGFGVDYFFNCHWGIGAGIKADYFNLGGTAQNYNLFAFPITVGLRYRF